MLLRALFVSTVVTILHWSGVASAIDLETVVMPGKVIEGHADIESDCSECHAAFSRDKQRILCMDCHEDVADDVDGGRGYHGRDEKALEQECAACHTEHIGRDADVVNFDPQTFEHHLSDFLLETGHQEVACEDCHAIDVKYREAPSICFDCHAEDDEHKGGLGEECQTCHRATKWPETEYDHKKETGYALIGGHLEPECTGCHIDNSYKDTPTDCYACHKADDSHKGLNGTDCAHCHVVRDWKETAFDHAAETKFALLGEHGKLECADCHVENKFKVKLKSDCVACHRDDDEHKGLNGDDCGDCHSASSWKETLFRHEVKTEFPLLGAHADLGCADCHVQPVHEVKLKTDCYSCHQEDDAHKEQLGKNCEQCHNDVDWTENVRFDHGLISFPLIGSHRDPSCEDCHETPRFKDAPEECIDCHRDEDVHKKKLGPDCVLCHIPTDWVFWNFDHNRQTDFVIDGAHVDVQCEACHARPMKRGVETSQLCGSCHRRDDVHSGSFGSDCERCHTTVDFRVVEKVGQ
jgi:hypothetical protein